MKIINVHKTLIYFYGEHCTLCSNWQKFVLKWAVMALAWITSFYEISSLCLNVRTIQSKIDFHQTVVIPVLWLMFARLCDVIGFISGRCNIFMVLSQLWKNARVMPLDQVCPWASQLSQRKKTTPSIIGVAKNEVQFNVYKAEFYLRKLATLCVSQFCYVIRRLALCRTQFIIHNSEWIEFKRVSQCYNIDTCQAATTINLVFTDL